MRHQAYKKTIRGIYPNQPFVFIPRYSGNALFNAHTRTSPPFTLRNNKIDICDYYIKTIRGENTKYLATTFVNNLRYGWR